MWVLVHQKQNKTKTRRVVGSTQSKVYPRKVTVDMTMKETGHSKHTIVDWFIISLEIICVHSTSLQSNHNRWCW